MTTLRLYQFATSPFCAKVRKILDYKGLACEIVEVDYLERKELLLASGQLMVPALTLENGEAIADSDQIAMRLDELYPEPTIFPPDVRGIHLALARYFDTESRTRCSVRRFPTKLRITAARGATTRRSGV